MNLTKVLVISPSGNFYGSEQVLADYLKHTQRQYTVFVPAGSIFLKLLLKAGLPHQIIGYNVKNLKLFYVSLFLKILSSNYQVIYLNEAGHSKYVLLLAKIFRKKKFVIHIRIVEDTIKERWTPGIPSNVQVLSISKYMEQLFFNRSIQLYDPYDFSDDDTNSLNNRGHGDNKLHIGIIGRISANKGLAFLLDLLERLKKNKNDDFIFHLFGEPDTEATSNGKYEKLRSFENTVVHGFVEEKDGIYDTIDCVMHLAQSEPLGRIFLEAIDRCVPLIGFDAAGIGEISNLTGLTALLIKPGSPDFINDLLSTLNNVQFYKMNYVQKYHEAKISASDIFSVKKYTEKMDDLLSF
ncbi:MAG: glycosyltransferase family 4 protein [Saprospiraceae bacterium]|nr:glycosyltransferase family 4 protein [Saprospiraceae bacterium]